MSKPKKYKFAIKDIYDHITGNRGPVEITVKVNSHCIAIMPKGFGDHCSDDGHGAPIIIEVREGIPFLVVWADINQEDPTHIISLSCASENMRKVK